MDTFPSQIPAIIVGEFQETDLTIEQRELLSQIMSGHTRTIIVLGTTPSNPTVRNPLPYSVRAAWLQQVCPHAELHELTHQPSQVQLSDALDTLLEQRAPGQSACIYLLPGSYLHEYTGHHDLVRLHGRYCSGPPLTELPPSREFRQGMIEAVKIRYPTPYPTVDIAVLDSTHTQVLLGSKPTDNTLLRFIGGFVDPTDVSLEAAAVRELAEEVGSILTTTPIYIGSRKIPDWRYLETKDGVITAFHTVTYLSGIPEARDDISHLEWAPVARLEEHLVPSHQPLGHLLTAWLAT